jgi:uncharacterized membrane protein YfcA
MYFEVAQIEVNPLLPLLVAFGISFLTSMGGVSGAFLLLPFQVSVLGFASPAVTPTNLVYNIGAIPPGVYRFAREGRMCWPLAALITTGSIPGLFAGVALRVHVLPDPRHFKLFVGGVLLYIGGRMVRDLLRPDRSGSPSRQPAGTPESTAVTSRGLTRSRLCFEFAGSSYRASTPGVLALSLLTGIIGGAYGIGGGAIMAPVLITFFRLPVHAVAGPALTGTCLSSVVGLLVYTLVGRLPGLAYLAVAPDWKLGLLLAAGGAVGIYCGARVQKHLPARPIKLILTLVIIIVASRYIWNFFFYEGS